MIKNIIHCQSILSNKHVEKIENFGKQNFDTINTIKYLQ